MLNDALISSIQLNMVALKDYHGQGRISTQEYNLAVEQAHKAGAAGKYIADHPTSIENAAHAVVIKTAVEEIGNIMERNGLR
jgi:D-aminopeptidase